MNNYWKNKKVIVTGAAGFIGSHVVDGLVSKGALVTAVISPATSENKIQRNLGNNLKNIRLVKVDLLDRDKLIDAFKNHDIVYHFAAIDGGQEFKMKRPAEIFTKNIFMTLNILEAARLLEVSKVYLMSSIEVYPRTLTGTIAEADTETTTLPSTEGYAWAKRTSETAAMLYAREYGMTVIIGRAGNIYGPRDYWKSEKSRVIPNIIMKALSGEEVTLTIHNKKIPFLYVGDFARVILELISKQNNTDIFNICSEEYVSLMQLAEIIVKLTKSSSNINLYKSKNLTEVNHFYSISKLRSGIKIRNTSLEKGLRKTIKYFHNDVL